MLSIYQTSVQALYSCSNADRRLLKERIDAVFMHATSIEEEFKTRHTWIKLLSTTSLNSAIDESHALLERLDEAIDSSPDVSFHTARSEAERVKECYLKETDVSALPYMTDANKLKAMKILASLCFFYYSKRNFMNTMVAARMVELTMKYGCSSEGPFALASFSAVVVTVLFDIDQGASWARMSLALISQFRHNANMMIPTVVSSLEIESCFEPCNITSSYLFSMELSLAFHLFG